MTCKKQNGFTLVELLVVISILSILATVSVVGYTAFIEKARVSNDNDLVGQLNTYIEAHKVGSTTPIGEKEIIDIMKHKDFDDIKIQSNKDGYDIYFNTLTEKFELLKLEDAKDKENLIPSDEWMNNANGNGTGNEGESTGTGVPDISGDPENSTDSSQPTEPTTPPEVDEPEKELTLYLKEFTQDNVYSYRDKIYVQINVNEEGNCKFATLTLDGIIDSNNCDKLEYEMITSNEISGYYGDELSIPERYTKENESIVFYTPGEYELKVIGKNSELDESISIIVKIVVVNVGMNDAIMDVSAMKNITISNVNEGIQVQLMKGMNIIEESVSPASDYYSLAWNQLLPNQRANVWNNTKFDIYINDILVEYEVLKDSDNNEYYAVISRYKSSEITSCYIIYYYRSLNGNWVQEKVTVK